MPAWENDPSTATPLDAVRLIAAFDAKLDVAARGASMGVAALDAMGLVVPSQIPDLSGTYLTPADIGAAVATQPALHRARAALSSSVMSPCYVAFCGDSYTQGGISTQLAYNYVNRLAARLRAAYPSPCPSESPVVPAIPAELVAAAATPITTPGVHVVNAAVGGSNSSNYLTPTTRGYINALAPKIVVHTLSTNDFILHTATATFKAAIEANIAAIPNATHILVRVFQRPDGALDSVPTWQAYGAAMSEIAAANPGRVTYIDEAPFFDAIGTTLASDPYKFISTDTIHPSDAGHAAMADEFARQMNLPAPAPTGWFAVDTFTRANVASIHGTRVEGWPTWASLGSAVYSISGGKAVPTTIGVVVIDALRADAEVAAVVKAGGDLAGVVARCSDVSNLLFAVLNSVNGKVTLYKTDAGANSALAFTVDGMIATGSWYLLRAVCLGSVVTVYLNGAAVITHTLSAGDQTKYGAFTKFGMYTSGAATMAFDNFGVRPAW